MTKKKDHDLKCSKVRCGKRAHGSDPSDPNNVDVLCRRHYTEALEAMPMDQLRKFAFPNATPKKDPVVRDCCDTHRKGGMLHYNCGLGEISNF